MPNVHSFPRRVVGQTPLVEQAFYPQFMHRPQRFFEGRVVVGGVKVEQLHRWHPVA